MTWPSVLLDCTGAPEPNPAGIIYRGIAGAIIVIALLLQADGSYMPVYDRPPEIEVFRTTETAYPYVLPDPLVGEVSYLHVETTDAAGNRSEDCQ